MNVMKNNDISSISNIVIISNRVIYAYFLHFKCDIFLFLFFEFSPNYLSDFVWFESFHSECKHVTLLDYLLLFVCSKCAGMSLLLTSASWISQPLFQNNSILTITEQARVISM